jgi:ATP-binding cassette, subfamily B, multidrug efflux pump
MKAMRKLLRFLKPYRHWAILAPLLMVVETAMDLMLPRMIQRIVDIGIANQDMTFVINTGLTMLGFSLIGAVAGIICTTTSVLAAQGFGTDLRDALFTKVTSLSFGNIDRLETGQLITRLTNDVTQVEQLVSMGLRIMIRAPLLVVGSLIMAILTSPRLAWMFIVLVPLIGAILTWVVNRAYPMFGDVQERVDRLNTVMQENLAGVRVVKAFVRQDHELGRFMRVNEVLKDIAVRAARTIAVAGPAISIALNLGVVAALWFGGIEVTQGTLKVGQIIAFVNYLMRTSWSLMFVSMLSIRIARAQASAKRIQEVLDSSPHVQDRIQAETPALRGRIAFENVTFSYNGDCTDPVLKGITFNAEPGETVAVLGATGSGKSSLIHLIPRFYDVSDGAVTIDGTDVRHLDKATLRRHVGVALQESVLFSGTIRDNIRYGRPDASDAEVVAAAKAAQAHDFITTFPDGYDTILGQRGVNLSGGQKQRVAIARALLVEPTILILDDSTSAVDVETESEIQEALEALMVRRHGPSITLKTSFIIAQRISTVLNADKILVLDDGRIAAEGTHADLMVSSAIYREIYDSQLGDGAADKDESYA